jgi:hypothetical protein
LHQGHNHRITATELLTHLAAKILDPYFTTKVTAVHDDHEAVQLCESALRKRAEF